MCLSSLLQRLSVPLSPPFMPFVSLDMWFDPLPVNWQLHLEAWIDSVAGFLFFCFWQEHVIGVDVFFTAPDHSDQEAHNVKLSHFRWH